MRDIPNQIKVKGYVVKITSDSDYGISSFCKENDKLNISREMTSIEKSEVDSCYKKNYNIGCDAYQKVILKYYDELFLELREIAKKLQ
jgi:hypothetical protein